MEHPLSISSLYGRGRQPKGSSIDIPLADPSVGCHNYRRMSFLFKTTSSYFINIQLHICNR